MPVPATPSSHTPLTQLGHGWVQPGPKRPELHRLQEPFTSFTQLPAQLQLPERSHEPPAPHVCPPETGQDTWQKPPTYPMSHVQEPSPVNPVEQMPWPAQGIVTLPPTPQRAQEMPKYPVAHIVQLPLVLRAHPAAHVHVPEPPRLLEHVPWPEHVVVRSVIVEPGQIKVQEAP